MAKEGASQERSTRVHPVLVAAERVDLSVVAKHSVGLRALPGRKGVGREARMDQGHVGREIVVLQIRVVPHQLARVQLPLVNDCART